MDFQTYQRAFTARIRDPKAAPRPPGATAKRMRVYETLLYNNLEGFLLACFPVCRQVLGIRRWRHMVRAFFSEHACHSPYFRHIPEEFLRFLQAGWTPPAGFPAFLPELAHYEWVELELDTADRDRHLPDFDPAGDLLDGRPLINPVAHVLAYRWPVHQLSPSHKPTSPPDAATFLAAWRNADFEVRFSQLSPAAAQLLNSLQADATLSGHAALTALAAHLGHPDPHAVLDFGHDLLRQWHAEGLVLGVRR